MKFFLASLMVVSGQFAHAFELNCKSTSGISLNAEINNAFIENFELSNKGKLIAESRRPLSASRSYDMFSSSNFTENLPYWSFMLASDKNCSYRLALPDEDLRDFTFVALLSSWGKGCSTQEVELLCNP